MYDCCNNSWEFKLRGTINSRNFKNAMQNRCTLRNIVNDCLALKFNEENIKVVDIL